MLMDSQDLPLHSNRVLGQFQAKDLQLLHNEPHVNELVSFPLCLLEITVLIMQH